MNAFNVLLKNKLRQEDERKEKRPREKLKHAVLSKSAVSKRKLFIFEFVLRVLNGNLSVPGNERPVYHRSKIAVTQTR
jgi:hypothetical protein